MDRVARLRQALEVFHRGDSFGEADYAALKAAVADIGRIEPGLVDGFIGLFFERHLLDDERRAELLALDDQDLLRAVRHRFKQVVAGGHDDHAAWHALSAHVREALAALRAPGGGFPSSISTAAGFSAMAVEQAVGALWAERGQRPTAREATAELLRRYVTAAVAAEQTFSTRDFPAVVSAKLDGQRLARGVLEVLSADEKALLSAQLDGASVEQWAGARGVSRATAYRLLARLKALMRTRFEERSQRTRLEVLAQLRAELPKR